ncbi:ArsC/Spx/MgsR family protein [Furfurilactobacillus sp. WILCCON 0119]|uniref:ArsC/Spx/MgsR family protein n=1 Tax=Furfurilactobacillus entadae TaxID=2922307 RepID=UPI0035E68F61
MISIYTLPSNYPSRRAVTWFKKHHIDFTEHRVHPSLPGLVKLPLKSFLAASENGLDDLLATRGKSILLFKKTHDLNEISLGEMLAFIDKDPTMLHFPIIFDSTHSFLQCGFSEDEIRTFIPHEIRQAELSQFL